MEYLILATSSWIGDGWHVVAEAGTRAEAEAKRPRLSSPDVGVTAVVGQRRTRYCDKHECCYLVRVSAASLVGQHHLYGRSVHADARPVMVEPEAR